MKMASVEVFVAAEARDMQMAVEVVVRGHGNSWESASAQARQMLGAGAAAPAPASNRALDGCWNSAIDRAVWEVILLLAKVDELDQNSWREKLLENIASLRK